MYYMGECMYTYGLCMYTYGLYVYIYMGYIYNIHIPMISPLIKPLFWGMIPPLPPVSREVGFTTQCQVDIPPWSSQGDFTLTKNNHSGKTMGYIYPLVI